uniref:Uncharacterized protein n=1 Tax=Pseudomonas aeruginosa TaxID=287 RepID=B3G1I5_PSEAI|nr:hypothetical protein PACL_0641 [Pseudomonas aeruginosa]
MPGTDGVEGVGHLDLAAPYQLVVARDHRPTHCDDRFLDHALGAFIRPSHRRPPARPRVPVPGPAGPRAGRRHGRKRVARC